MKYLITLLTSLLFLSISHLPTSVSCNILGKWKGTTIIGAATANFQTIFRTDGTYTQDATMRSSNVEGNIEVTFDGVYRVSNDKLIYTCETINVTDISVPSKEMWLDAFKEMEGLVLSGLITLCDESAGVLETYNIEEGTTTTMIRVK